jgi:hypothetical protein
MKRIILRREKTENFENEGNDATK